MSYRIFRTLARLNSCCTSHFLEKFFVPTTPISREPFVTPESTHTHIAHKLATHKTLWTLLFSDVFLHLGIHSCFMQKSLLAQSINRYSIIHCVAMYMIYCLRPVLVRALALSATRVLGSETYTGSHLSNDSQCGIMVQALLPLPKSVNFGCPSRACPLMSFWP